MRNKHEKAESEEESTNKTLRTARTHTHFDNKKMSRISVAYYV